MEATGGQGAAGYGLTLGTAPLVNHHLATMMSNPLSRDPCEAGYGLTLGTAPLVNHHLATMMSNPLSRDPCEDVPECQKFSSGVA
ncbi:hypothetical protein AXF42_Ash000963 [Apostasia shenzhenica]|uniref:Uncharacterized protein n=1 Tax=Apostasia shenzhenica TaxID=1088818 RepID=A0A2I0ATK3_9ASPA|nr:hypothetical protein AXF42_Ash000963 [Apostasia shenzhenica]